jgi:hypothetical protein
LCASQAWGVSWSRKSLYFSSELFRIYSSRVRSAWIEFMLICFDFI